MGVDIPSKLRLAIGSVKDHASIGKAMMDGKGKGKGLSAIEIAVLRATGHDMGPIQDKYMHEILFLVSNSPGSIPFLAERISRRLCNTRDRLVALKTLSLIHRLLRGGNRCFEQQLRSAHLSGHLQILTISKYSSSDSFLHSYAAYLEERVGWAINQAGKLEPIMFNGALGHKSVDIVFRKLPKCQAFIDRVLDCSPRDIVPSDNLAQAAMGNTLKESFQVFSMFCEGIQILVNIFFDLTNPARTLATDILNRASRQTKDLLRLYDTCKQILVNKNLDYPMPMPMPGHHSMDHVLANYSTTTSPSPSILSDPMGKEITQKEGNGSQIITSSSTHFSCTLETKITKVWVVFEDDDLPL